MKTQTQPKASATAEKSAQTTKAGERTQDKSIETVEWAVLRAYADCHGNNDSFVEPMRDRNLNFCHALAISKTAAVKIMKKAIPDGYNEFDAELLDQLPRESRIRIAREGSVCVYVETPNGSQINQEGLKADEFDLYQTNSDGTQTHRIWWD
jgi:hypothetical protein